MKFIPLIATAYAIIGDPSGSAGLGGRLYMYGDFRDQYSSVQSSSVLFHVISVIRYKFKITYLQATVGYKITKKIIQFNKHYLVKSDDQR